MATYVAAIWTAVCSTEQTTCCKTYNTALKTTSRHSYAFAFSSTHKAAELTANASAVWSTNEAAV